MLKVLLVDDEQNVIKLLKELVNWDGLGYEIQGEAFDGREALQQLEGFAADLVIADINMPNMSGLELAAAIRRSRPGTRVILITGFNEFSFARQAVNIGVYYFLLKPIDQAELEEVLRNLQKQLQEEQAANRSLEELKSRADLSLRTLREEFCRDLICGKLELSPAAISAELKRLQISVTGERFQALVIEIDHCHEYPESEQDYFKNALWEIITEVMSEIGNYISVFMSEQRLALIIGESASPSLRSGLMVLSEKIRLMAADSGRFTVTIGCGTSYQGYDLICQTYYEAVNALNYKFVLGNNRVIHHHSLDMINTGNVYCTESQRNEILIHLRLGNYQQLAAMIQTLLAKLNDPKIAREQLQMLCMELVVVCLEFINENGLSLREVYGKLVNPWEELRQKELLADATHWVLELFRKAIEVARLNKASGSKKLLERTIQYIEDNLSDQELSVHLIAQKMHINEDYLSSLFKKEFGLPLVKYLNHYRLQKSKELMDRGSCNLNMIAAKVGFEDQNYFSKCFKKHYGISPSKYLEGK